MLAPPSRAFHYYQAASRLVTPILPHRFQFSELDDHALRYYLVAWGITLVSLSFS